MSKRDTEALIHQFVAWGYDQRGWSQETRRQYAGSVRAAERWLREHRRVALPWATIQDLRAWLWSTHPAPKARNAKRAALVGLYAMLIDLGVIAANPAVGLPVLKLPDPLPRAFPQESAQRLAGAARLLQPWERALCYLYLYGGLRNSEGRLLEWHRVSADHSWVHIVGKGGRKRDVKLREPAQRALAAWHLECWDPRWVFPSPLPDRRGLPMGETMVRDAVRRLGHIAGIDDLRPHALRHTVATRLLRTGTDIRDVAVFLGHASIRTTEIYTKVEPADIEAAVERLDF